MIIAVTFSDGSSVCICRVSEFPCGTVTAQHVKRWDVSLFWSLFTLPNQYTQNAKRLQVLFRRQKITAILGVLLPLPGSAQCNGLILIIISKK